MTTTSHRPIFFGMMVLGVIVIPPLFATGQSWEIVPLAAIASLTALFWRPVQFWARSLERGEPSTHDDATDRRHIALLQQEMQAIAIEQRRLREVVAWQEQLLWRAVGEPDGHQQTPKQFGLRSKATPCVDQAATRHDSIVKNEAVQGEYDGITA